MGMTHSCKRKAREKGFDGSVLLEQEISKLSTTKSGFKLMPCITTGGLQGVQMAFR